MDAGKNIKWVKGEGDGNFGGENQDLKRYGVGEEYQVVGKFIHLWMSYTAICELADDVQGGGGCLTQEKIVASYSKVSTHSLVMFTYRN